jgi:hypothetical protein
MKTKIFGFFIMMLLSSIIILPAMESLNINTNQNDLSYNILSGNINPHPQPFPPVGRNIKRDIIYPENDLSLMNGDIIISDSVEDDISPYLTSCFGDNLMVAYAEQSDIFTSHNVISISTDGGDNWQPFHFDWGEYNTNPAVTFSGNRAVAGWIHDPSVLEANPLLYIIEDEEDLTDPAGWYYSSWYWQDYNAYNWHDLDLAGCQPYGEKPFFWGIGSFIGSVEYETWAYATEAPFIMTDYSDIWPDSGDYIFGMSPITQWNNSRTSSVDIDQNAEKGYLACDFLNNSDETYDIGILEVPIPTLWENNAVWNFYEISGGIDTSYINPDVSVDENTGGIVCETSENGNQDIICFITQNGFSTTTKIFIANSPEDETNPSINSNDGEMQCTFIKNGNLFVTISTDNGETWSEPQQINDEDGTVRDGWRSSDIITGGYTVWTDERNGNSDIFFDIFQVAGNPIIEINDIEGGFGISVVIENSGTGDAIDLQWSIDLEGALVIIGGHKEDTIPTLLAGDNISITTGFVFGLGSVTITVSANEVSKTATGTIIGPFVINVI